MTHRRVCSLVAPPGLALALFLAGCGSQSDTGLPPLDASRSPSAATTDADSGTGLADVPTTTPGSAPGIVTNPGVDPDALLRAVVQLVQTAPTNPGGSHFDIAKDYLNLYFADASPADFHLSDASRAYLKEHLGPAGEKAIADLEVKTFTVRDARHIEDCLLLSAVARRVAGDGDDLTRVRRVFDWLVRQVQLVPAGALAVPGGMQAQARPYDVLMRAMATEQGGWAERAWLFLSLCRQLGLDAGLVIYTPPSRGILEVQPAAAPAAPAQAVWCAAVLVEGQPYLFDCRLGLPIPGPDGQGVATLEQAITDPTILAQLDLPGRPYPARLADLQNGKLHIWVDSSLGHLSARMRQLQDRLAGRDRMVLYRDPAEQHAAFATALGDRFSDSKLWDLPMQVEYQLFNDPRFVEATQYAIMIFDSKWPLLPARLAQLRGELPAAVQSYAAFRFSENPVENDGKTPIPPPVADVLDQYATYFLGLAKLDQGEDELARKMFEQTIRLLPAPGPRSPYFALYRWGAHTNLGYIHEAQGRPIEAIRHLAEPQATPQEPANLLRARRLIWEHPFVPDAPETPADAPRTAANAR